MSEHEPGTVAVATVRGVPNVRVMRSELHRARPYWVTAEAVEGWGAHTEAHVTDIRPLVALDLDEANDAISRSEVAAAAIKTLRESPYLSDSRLADQIEAQIETRIPEPGLYGVVSARIGEGGPWVLTRSEYGWVCLDDGAVWAWETLIDPVLVRDGIEATS